MGKLKPIGSEKLTGMDAISRIIEISNYNLNKPNPINETHSFEYKKTLADNLNYFIVKEKTGYVIKKGLYESTSEYIDPMKHRKFYPSYSQALKRLNLITKEINVNEGYEHNISLFEGDSEDRYFLKMETNEQEQPAQQPRPVPQQQKPAPQSAQQQSMPTDVPPPSPKDDMGMGDMPEDDMPEDDMPEDDMGMDDEGMEEDENITYKTLQKYTGKLAQKVRQFLSDENNQLSSQDILYILNSVISSLPLQNLEVEDKEKVMSKFEGGEQEYEIEVDGEEGMGDMPEDDMGMGDMPKDDMGMGEEGMGGQKRPQAEMQEDDMGVGRENRNMRDRQNFKRQSLYSESNIDKVLNKYFKPQFKNKTWGQVQKISESHEQEESSKKFLTKYPKANLLGKNSKGDLVFEMYDERFNITQNGRVI